MGNDASKQTGATTSQQNGIAPNQTEGRVEEVSDRTMTSNGDVKSSRDDSCRGCQPDDRVELSLPADRFRHSSGVSFDIGGSRCKVAIAQKGTDCHHDESKDDMVKVVVLVYHRSKLKDALNYIKNNFAEFSSVDGQRTNDKRVIRACGWSVKQEARDVITRELHADVNRVEEFSLLVNGFKCLLDGLPDADLFFGDSPTVNGKINALAGGLMQMMAAAQQQQQQPDPQQQPSEPPAACSSNDAGDVNDVTNVPTASKADNGNLPYLIANSGSGTSFILVSPDGTYRYVQGTHQGGNVLTSLAKLLVGTSDYKEVMELAVKGDESRVSTMCRDLRSGSGEKDYYDFMPEDIVVFPFGKLADKKAEGARREDLAAALVDFIVGAIAIDSFWVAVAHKCHTVYVTGGLFEHSFVRDMFELWFKSLAILSGKMHMNCRLVKLTSILPAIGALVDDQQWIENTAF